MPLLKNYTYLVYLLETTELKYMKFIDTWWYCWWQKILCHKQLWVYWYFLMLVTDFMVLWSRHKKMHKNIRTLSSYRTRGGSRAAATSKMECFVIIVNGFQPLTIITKYSILDVAAALHPPLRTIKRTAATGIQHAQKRNKWKEKERDCKSFFY